MSSQIIKLTQYSHGAGCGCKISPKILDQILKSNLTVPDNERLIVGNHSKDDAAVYDLGNGTALVATTDFFMPIVDSAFDFGRIASANAISDVYAMGGRPIMAIAMLGWPVNILPPEIAQQVIAGSRYTCQQAGIPLAGGHSIDSPAPIFGLAVNGLVDIKNIKQNNNAREGDLLFLTKPLGVGIFTTAEKKGLLKEEHRGLSATQMMQLNSVGEVLGACSFVTAMTDVTGFGLLGHLIEMAEGSGASAVIDFSQVPLISPALSDYIQQGSVPGGTQRNWDSYGEKIVFNGIADGAYERAILADPQTSGGLLIAVDRNGLSEIQVILEAAGLSAFTHPIGRITARNEDLISVSR